MRHTIQHTITVRRSFDDICHILSRHGSEVLTRATEVAARRSRSLAVDGPRELPLFDAAEHVRVQIEPLVQSGPHQASLQFTWDAHAEKRLLPNVDARIDLHPMVHRGPHASTTLRLHATYAPAPGARRTPDAMVFGKRVVKSALHRLVDNLTSQLETYEESIFA